MKIEKRDHGEVRKTKVLYATLAVAAIVIAGVMLNGYAEGRVDKALGGYYRGADDAEVIIKDFSDFT